MFPRFQLKDSSFPKRDIRYSENSREYKLSISDQKWTLLSVTLQRPGLVEKVTCHVVNVH